MAQVDPHRKSEDALGASLGAATEQLREALEREAVAVINKARAQAANIEEAARHRAGEIEQEARERALTVQSDRFGELMDSVDALEEKVGAMLDGLRDELRGAVDEIGQSTDAPAEPVSDQWPQDEYDVPQPEPVESGKGVAFHKPIPMNLATEAHAATDRSPELDEMMRAQLVTMVESGKSRADAERFVSNFRFGDSYIGLVDEIYSEQVQDQGRRRITGGKRRRRSLRRT